MGSGLLGIITPFIVNPLSFLTTQESDKCDGIATRSTVKAQTPPIACPQRDTSGNRNSQHLTTSHHHHRHHHHHHNRGHNHHRRHKHHHKHNHSNHPHSDGKSTSSESLSQPSSPVISTSEYFNNFRAHREFVSHDPGSISVTTTNN